MKTRFIVHAYLLVLLTASVAGCLNAEEIWLADNMRMYGLIMAATVTESLRELRTRPVELRETTFRTC